MNKTMPRTPLSTPLSGSAKETELRLKNIFSGPKKRPPVLFLALMCAVCLLCGNLVSCQTRPAEEPEPEIPVQLGDRDPELADEGARWMLYWEDAVQTLLEQSQGYVPEQPGWAEVLLSERGEELNLLLLGHEGPAHAAGFYNLVLGTFDQEGSPVDFYELPGDAGLWSAWEEGGALHLLCANTTTYSGEEGGGPPMYFRFDGKTLEVVDLGLEGKDRKYLPIPGALEVYRRNEAWSAFEANIGVPQWEYLETIQVSNTPIETAPQAVYRVARDYIDSAEWEGVPTVGSPILRLEQMAEWTDFSGCSLCPEWQDREDLTLVAWDLDFGDPGSWNNGYMGGYAHFLFLKEGDELTFLTTFYDHNSEFTVAPEPDYLAALSPYNWYASVTLAEKGYLTARPRMAETITLTPTPQAVWELARNRYEYQVDSLEPVAVVTTEPGWVGVYRLNGAYLAFFEMSDFRTFSNCLTIRPEAEVSDLERAALAAYWGLLDYEVALWDLSQGPYWTPAVGPGANRDFFLTVQEEGLADETGWTATGDRFTARFRSVPGNESGWGYSFTESLDTTRRLPTTRGVKVGDSLSQVRAAYPELRNDMTADSPYVWVYRGEQGAVMEFYFEHDTLSRIVLKCS